MSYSRKTKKPLKMIYFLKSININIFLLSTKRSKVYDNIFQLTKEPKATPFVRTIAPHIKNDSRSSLTTNFLFRTPYANECESEAYKRKNMLCIWCRLPNHLEFFLVILYDFVCCHVRPYIASLK